GLSFHRYGRPRAPPSFPTRRSSDLGFEAPNATVRGGSITVTHGSVIAREIGSPSAALTEIIVGPEGSIKAEMIYPNVRCVVGQRQYRADSPKRHLVLHLDRATGELQIGR